MYVGGAGCRMYLTLWYSVGDGAWCGGCHGAGALYRDSVGGVMEVVEGHVAWLW